MLDLISKGGALVWVLLGCFGLALAIFAERISYYHRAGMNVGEFLAGLASLIRRKNYAEALQECVATRVPAGRVLHAALLRHHATREQLKDIVQEAGQLEVPRLERYLSVLHGIAHATPLIGLLGTILGLMNTFTRLNNVNGYATPADVANGVFLALITSALGLVVAIPSYLFYSFLAAKARHLMHDLERAGIEIVNILEDNREPAHAAPAMGAQIVEFRKADSGSALKRG
ncbi:MotA/TolQ/ExbB proton channel family protein [Roseimicrobium sp. ORNL1]|uniref:MotA/TolQ/ExbB proton channel family protein n=1 Tax=Roseimicrobium sp. ORNL1 TaxID=2711231 RepID=UPI0013E13CC4|nr:MotA/TolQ/ExbB proton channel family protein [Roseimicrobium sp. ORNL1]QIF05202.1 MotA/TolQ/ExbB proton channel family protein [Roseimicrobium sp. ORNL1]